MNNAYPEKPLVPYKRTQVDMALVIAYIKSLPVEVEVKRATYIFFRNESANGRSGVCNNYGGIQADSGRWPQQYDSKIIGVTKKEENSTGTARLFCAFKDFTTSVDFLAGRIKARGLYVGGKTHKIINMSVVDPIQFARAYYKEWVKGSPSAEPSTLAMQNFLAMYKQAKTHFSNGSN